MLDIVFGEMFIYINTKNSILNFSWCRVFSLLNDKCQDNISSLYVAFVIVWRTLTSCRLTLVSSLFFSNVIACFLKVVISPGIAFSSVTTLMKQRLVVGLQTRNNYIVLCI